MNHFPEIYFDLAGFAHAALFDSSKQVWEALNAIRDYFLQASFGFTGATISPQAYLVHPDLISLGEGTVVEPGAYVEGPCILGKGCTVRHGAYVRGNLIAGNGCVIGHATEVKNTIFLNGAKAAHFAYLGDSILGNDVNLGAGVKCANLRFDGKEVKLEGRATGRRKFGAMIGDRAQVGCNCVTLPGTLMGKEALAYPAIAFGGVIPAGTRVREGI